jgi:hypothetical protein
VPGLYLDYTCGSLIYQGTVLDVDCAGEVPAAGAGTVPMNTWAVKRGMPRNFVYWIAVYRCMEVISIHIYLYLIVTLIYLYIDIFIVFVG